MTDSETCAMPCGFSTRSKCVAVGENEGLDVWQPGEPEVLSLIPYREILASGSDKDRLGYCDSPAPG